MTGAIILEPPPQECRNCGRHLFQLEQLIHQTDPLRVTTVWWSCFGCGEQYARGAEHPTEPMNDPNSTPDPNPHPTPAPDEPVALAPDSIGAQLRQNPAQMKQFVEALLDRAGVQIPDDYDVESAFGDCLAIGAVAHDPAVQGPLARLGYWLFLRLPREDGGG